MASTLKIEYQVFLCIFQKNSAMATLGLKEMEKLFWEGREKGLPVARCHLRQPQQSSLGKCKKKIWYYEKWVGRHASFPPRRSVKLVILSQISMSFQEGFSQIVYASHSVLEQITTSSSYLVVSSSKKQFSSSSKKSCFLLTLELLFKVKLGLPKKMQIKTLSKLGRNIKTVISLKVSIILNGVP